MKRLDIFIIKSYAGPFVLTFFISLFILVMQFLWRYVDDLVGKGLEWYIIAELLMYASSTFVPLALPLAILLSSLMTFGNLGELYELVAMKAAGISIRRIMKPLVILSFFISILAFLFSNYMLPIANLKFHSLLYDVRQQKLAINIKEGIFYNGIDGFTIRIGKKEPEKNIIRDVMIYDHSDRLGNVRVTVAKWGTMEMASDKTTLVFTLYDGYNYEEVTDRRNYKITRPFQRSQFKEQTRRFGGLDFTLNRTNQDLFKNNYQMMNLGQLNQSKDSLSRELTTRKNRFKKSVNEKFSYLERLDSLIINPSGTQLFDTDIFSSTDHAGLLKAVDMALQSARSVKNTIEFNKQDFQERQLRISKHLIEWHRKFTLSIACFILFFIGAPLGAIIRKGGFGLPVVISIFFFVLFHIISITGEKYARAGVIEPKYAMWLASAVLLPIGIFLTYKATTDSPLLDSDSWNRFFKKIMLVKKSDT